MIRETVKAPPEVHRGCWTLTRDLHSEGVAADANEVEGHALHRHPAVGQPHGEDALHLHGSVLLPLHLHRESLGKVLPRQAGVVPIAPASLQRVHKQTSSLANGSRRPTYDPRLLLLTSAVSQNTGTR